MKLFNVFKQVYYMGQCRPDDVQFKGIQDWWERWKDDPEFLKAVQEFCDDWLKNNQNLETKD